MAYDGTKYLGFQRLPEGQPTIQGMLEWALERISGGKVTVRGAGRTDAGVHAIGQVIAFDLAWRHPDNVLMNAMNALLPKEIVVQRLERAAPDFDPRYGAARRVYEYRVYTAPVRNPVLDRIAWWVGDALDLEAMNAAAALLVGAHDFASFGSPPRGERGTTRRVIYHSAWSAAGMLLGGMVYCYRVEANAFLYRMVRTITAGLVEVGRGRWSVAYFEAAFKACDRETMRKLAPPNGLTLVEVKYLNGGETPAEQVEQ